MGLDLVGKKLGKELGKEIFIHFSKT